MSNLIEFPIENKRGIEPLDKTRFMALLMRVLEKQNAVGFLINPRARDIENAHKEAAQAVEDLWEYCSKGVVPNPVMRYLKEIFKGGV